MLPGNMMRLVCAVAGVAMVLSGCASCGGPGPVDCTDTTIAFETPTADQTVDSPFEVSVNVKLPDGAAFGIDSAQLSVSDGAPINGTVSGNRATFAGVTAAPGAQTLAVTIAKGSCSKSSSAQTITVRDACTTAAVTAVSFPQDTAAGGLGVLNRAELPPGTNLQVQVDARCVTDVQVRIKRGTTEVSPLTSFVNGSAVITLPSLPDSDNARYELFAELVRGTTVLNTPADAAANGSIQVSRALPTCAVTAPTRCLGAMDDADNMAAGFQLRVNGTMAMGTTGTIGIPNQMPVVVTPNMSGDVSADFTLSASGTYVATITCNDVNGNTNTATGSYCADFEPPTVTITSPSNVDGGATTVVTQSPLVITASTDAENGSLAEVTRNGVAVGTGVVSGGMVTLNVPFGADGTFTIVVRVTDRAGNTSTASLLVTVALTGCGAEFSRPMACPALLTPTQMPSGTYSFQTTSKSVCVNQPAALFRADVLADGGISAEVAAGTSTLTAAGLANFPASTITSGDYVFRAQVTNVGADAGVSTVSCQVTVDLEGPAITNPIVPTGQPYATINAVQDGQGSTPGVQRILTFTGRVPAGGRTDVCTTQALNPNAPLSDGGFTTRPTSAECGSGWYVLQQGVTSPANGFTFPDGSYQVKIVVVGGGLATAPASPPVAVFVDSIRPCVNGITRSLPQDLDGDGRLNLAELAGGQPQLVFGLGCGDTSPSTLAATGAVTVRDITGGVAGAVRPATASFANGNYTVTLTGTYASEVELDLFVELTDLAANRNQLQPTNDPGRFTFRIDPVAPVCNITSPSAALLGSAQVPGGNLDVIVATSADVAANGVNVTFTGFPARPLTPTLSQAQTTYALTGDNSYTIAATCTDQSGNVGTASGRTTRVDLLPPTCNITTPASPFASAVNDITTTVAVTGLVDNDTVTLGSSVAGITNNVLTVTSGTATGSVRYPNGAQTVTVSASDAAGNACVAPTGGRLQISLTVNSTSCNLDFNGGTVITNANGSWINRVSAANPMGASPTTVSIGALTSDCGVGKNVYLYQGAPSATPTGTPQVTNAGGTVSFAGTSVSEGQQWTITIDNGAGVLTHRTFTASFAMPSIASIGLQRSSTVTTVIPVAANAPLTFGAASGNRRVATAVATDMVFADLDGVTADAQFQLTLTGIDGARVGTLNAALDVLEGSAPLMATIPVTTAAFSSSLSPMNLAHRLDDTTTTLVIRVASPAGNVFTSTHVAEVDVIAPAAPNANPMLTSARAATVSLSWSPVYDDAATPASGGLTGGTPVAGYDVRWTTSSVPSNNSMAAESDYFGSSSNADGLTAWSASAINKALTLPPLNSYFISVRARDEVGNYSTFGAPTAVTNPWTEVVLTRPAGTTQFGQVVASGASLNNDATADLVVAVPDLNTNAGAVFVYWGGSGFSDQTGCSAPSCQVLSPSDATGGLFGTDISMAGNVGDLAGEGKRDLLVSQPTWNTTQGRLFLFFGTSTQAQIDTSSRIEIRGEAGIRFASTAQVIRDINQDGLDEIAVSAHGYNANQGRVLIFAGRSVASWLALQTAGAGSIAATANATWILDGPPLTAGITSNDFGRLRFGLGSLGDLNADGRSEFAVPMSREQFNRVLIYSGAAVAAAVAPVPASAALQVVSSPFTPAAPLTSLEGFGRRVLGGSNFVDAAAVDLLISYPLNSTLYLYSDLGGTGVNGTPLSIPGANGLGTHTTLADLNVDTRADLVVSEGLTDANRSWVLYKNSAATPFDAPNGVPRFNVSLFAGALGSRLGRCTASGDVNGDTLDDLILSDEGLGVVRIWR